MDRSTPRPRTLRAAATAVAATLALLASGTPVLAHDDHRSATRLSGFLETPLSLSTTGKGRFKMAIDERSGSIAYDLSYDGLEAPVRMAHIHLGQRGTSGGIMVWLCQTANFVDPTGLAPPCPQSGTVSGLIQAANVIGPGAQGVEALAFNELLAAIRAGAAYVNVHTDKYPPGEIRGQIRGDD